MTEVLLFVQEVFCVIYNCAQLGTYCIRILTMSASFFVGSQHDERTNSVSSDTAPDIGTVHAQHRTSKVVSVSKLNSQAGHKNASKVLSQTPTYLPPTEYMYIETRDDLEIEVCCFMYCFASHFTYGSMCFDLVIWKKSLCFLTSQNHGENFHNTFHFLTFITAFLLSI
jgi:hypothetical protein